MLKALIGALLLGGTPHVGQGFVAQSPGCWCSPIVDDGLMALMAHEDEESPVISGERHTTSIANQTFQLPRANDLDVIEQQVFHQLDEDQVFCVSSSPCRHGFPQAFGFHPTKGPKPVSGLFRLSW